MDANIREFVCACHERQELQDAVSPKQLSLKCDRADFAWLQE
jgi:hypothetical protein